MQEDFIGLGTLLLIFGILLLLAGIYNMLDKNLEVQRKMCRTIEKSIR